MYKKILVAMDDSAMNRPVFEAAQFLAKCLGAELKLVYVVDPEQIDSQRTMNQAMENLPPYPSNHEGMSCYLGHIGQTEAGRYVEEAIAAGISATFVSCFGIPGSTLCEVARNWQADLLIMGRRGISEKTEQALGSVSGYVVRHAPCAVHIIPRPEYVDLDVPSVEQASQIFG